MGHTQLALSCRGFQLGSITVAHPHFCLILAHNIPDHFRTSVSTDDMQDTRKGAEHPFPLPRLSRTEPHLVIKPHPAVTQVGVGTTVSNREEISPSHPRATAGGEIPLIIFTLFAQMAIGAFWTVCMINWMLNDKLVAKQITFIPLLAVGAAITIAMLASLFHLGTPWNAWRALNHLRKSWLSREILFISGFAGSWAVLTGLSLRKIDPFSSLATLTSVTAICGLAALYCMQRVYQLRSVPAWNTGRTFLEFSISTLGLGCFLTGTLVFQDAPAAVILWITLAGMLAFSAASMVTLSMEKPENLKLSRWRASLLLAGLLGSGVIIIWPSSARLGSMLIVFLIALLEEAIGRWLFYSRRNPGI